MKNDLFLPIEFDSKEIRLIDQQDHQFRAYRKVLLQISNDLRAPAAIIKSNIQSLDHFTYQIDKISRDRSLRIFQSSLEKVIRFIDKLQLLNITLNPDLKPLYSKFRIKTLVHNLFLDEEIKKESRRIKLYWNAEHPVISSDYSYLRQIILHLLSNALKFSSGDVHLLISNSLQKTSIIIKDSGIGILDEEQKAVFTPFYRAKNSQGIPGAGMGLAIVNTLVKCLGAELFLSSIPEEGTIIRIILRDSSGFQFCHNKIHPLKFNL